MKALLTSDYLAFAAQLLSALRAVGRVMFEAAAEWEALGEERAAYYFGTIGPRTPLTPRGSPERARLPQPGVASKAV